MLSRYFLGLLLEQLIMIGMITLGMHLIGLPNALLIGLIAGIFNIIPYVGPIIGDIIGLAIGLTTLQGADFMSESLPLMMKMFGVFMIANLIDNFVLQPLIYSKSVKAHPLEIFLVVIMAGMMAGPLGMILAIPAYTIIRIIAMEFFSIFPPIRSITKSLNTELQKNKKDKENKE
jgi:predicted PurR-regulated permease PerM